MSCRVQNLECDTVAACRKAERCGENKWKTQPAVPPGSLRMPARRLITHAGSLVKLRMLARRLIYACWLNGYFARQMKGLSDLARLRLTLCCEMLAIADYGDRSGFGSLNTYGWDGNETVSYTHLTLPTICSV